MRNTSQYPRRSLTEAEERSLAEVHLRVASYARRQGVRGQDVDDIVAGIEEKWLLDAMRRAPYFTPAPPTFLDVRRAVADWWRGEARTHAREMKAGATVRADCDPVASLIQQEECRSGSAAVRRALLGLEGDDVRALALRARGAAHAEIAALLGGSSSRWCRRVDAIQARLAAALGSAGLDSTSDSLPLLDAFREAMEQSSMTPGTGRPGGRPPDAPSEASRTTDS